MKHLAHRQGMAAILAIFSVAFVATALGVLTVSFRGEYLRTATANDDAQMRQLLLAGAADVGQHARQWPASPGEQQWAVALPADLEQKGNRVSIDGKSDAASSMDIDIRADYGQKSDYMRLHYQRIADHWQLADVWR